MLQTKPAEPVPTCCGQCEFSFDISAEHTTDLVACTRDSTHHKFTQPLCPWYVRLGLLDLKLELVHIVPPWQKAIKIWNLPQPASPEAIANIIDDTVGKKLSTVKGRNHEK